MVWWPLSHRAPSAAIHRVLSASTPNAPRLPTWHQEDGAGVLPTGAPALSSQRPSIPLTCGAPEGVCVWTHVCVRVCVCLCVSLVCVCVSPPTVSLSSTKARGVWLRITS